MYRLPIVKLKLISDSSFTVSTNQISNPQDAVAIFQEYLAGVDREHLVLATLNTKNILTTITTVSIGSLTTSIVHPREVFKTAILANAATILLAHNHPSGDPTPSKEDINITIRLKESGHLLGIDLLDHIIVGGSNYISLKEKGLL